MSRAGDMTADLASNAFNQGSGYSYSHDDLRRVGEQLMKQITPRMDSAILAFPLGNDTVDVPSEFRKFTEDLVLGKKVAGAYCTGGHWIAYVMFKDGEQYKAWYKDASGGGDGGLAGFLTAAFPGIEIKAANNTSEQASGGTCGIFALRNAIVFAGLSDEALKAEVLLAPFVTEADIANDRVNFAKLFARSVIEEVYNDVMRKEMLNLHINEALAIKAILADAESVDSISYEESGYVYRVKCKLENMATVHARLDSIFRKFSYDDNGGQHVYFSIDPRSLKLDVDETSSLREMIQSNSSGVLKVNKLEVLRLVFENLYVQAGNEAQFAMLEGVIEENFPALKTTNLLAEINAETPPEYDAISYDNGLVARLALAEGGARALAFESPVEGVAALGEEATKATEEI